LIYLIFIKLETLNLKFFNLINKKNKKRNMKKILLISFYLIAYTCMNNLAVKCHSLSYEEQIRNEISNSNYSIKMRPSLPTTIHVKILFGQIGEKKKSYFKYIIAKLLFLSQFLYYYVEVILDELKQIITTSSNLFVDWFDQRLAWNASKYGGVDNILVYMKEVWTPDLYVANTADSNGYVAIRDSSIGILMNNGLIYSDLPLIGIFFFSS
jgi:hypothetical protein